MKPEFDSVEDEINASLTINPNRIDLDEAYMQMAEIWAKRSKAVRKQVGALVIKNRQIISDGYNGMPTGEKNDVCEKAKTVSGVEYVHKLDSQIKEEYPYEFVSNLSVILNPKTRYKLVTRPELLHAESNALMKLVSNGGMGAEGGTLYVTMSPCIDCAKLIRQAKIARVVYREEYRITDGIDFLKERDVQVDHLPKP